MKNITLTWVSIILLSIGFIACGENVSVVDSGTYNGIIEKVEDDNKEIYVKISENRLIELYFTSETALTKDGKKVPFELLDVGQAVEVSVEKIGQRLDPLTVKILD